MPLCTLVPRDVQFKKKKRGQECWKSLLLKDDNSAYLTGIPPLRAIFRTFLGDIDGITGARLSADQNIESLFNLSAAFLYDLAIQLCHKPEKRGVLQRQLVTDPRAGAFPFLFDTRIVEPFEREEGYPDFVAAFLHWRGEMRDGRDDQEILAPFLGRPGDEDVVTWPAGGKVDRGRDSLREYVLAMGCAVDRRCLFVTERGYMGLGPPGVHNGDKVCVLPGCSFPLLLRGVREHYVLVGEAYVCGIMDGEVLDDVGKAPVQLLNIQ